MKFDWQTNMYPFGAVLSIPIRNGLTKPKAIRGTGVKMIGMGEIFAYDRIGNIGMDRVPVTEAEMASSGIEPGDLLFARQSLVASGAGKCSIVTEVKEPTVFESHLIRARVNPSIASPEYMYYYFCSPKGRAQVLSLVEQVAAAGIRGKDLIKLPIDLPALEVQEYIADTLTCIDTKIELNLQINETLEEYISSALENMLLNGQTTPAKLGDYLYIKGRIGWKGLKKEEYLDKSQYRIINGESLTKSGIVWEKAGFISEERYIESPEIMLQPNDILLSKDGTIGKIGFVDSLDLPTTVASGIFVIRNEQPEILSTIFIYYLLKSRLFQSFITMRTEGSVIPHLYQKDFMEFEFPLPSKEDMKIFDNNVSATFDHYIKNLNENKQLVLLRDGLIPKLMDGTLVGGIP